MFVSCAVLVSTELSVTSASPDNIVVVRAKMQLSVMHVQVDFTKKR